MGARKARICYPGQDDTYHHKERFGSLYFRLFYQFYFPFNFGCTVQQNCLCAAPFTYRRFDLCVVCDCVGTICVLCLSSTVTMSFCRVPLHNVANSLLLFLVSNA